MEPIRIVVTDYIEPDLEWEQKQLAKYPRVTLDARQLKFAPAAELIRAIEDADVVLVNMAPMTAEVIGALRKCRLIIRHGVGYDNVDVKAATKKGIRVAYEPDYCTDEVAEHAVALILSAWRKVGIGRKVLEESSAKGIWNFAPIYPIHTLKGRTVGIVGCGRIGGGVLQRMKGFGVRFLVYDPYLSPGRAREMGVEPVSLEEVLAGSDIVTLHATLSDETRNLIGEKQLSMMKPDAYLVNTARGGLVDTDALVRALREKRIAGAAVDVYVKEPPDRTSPLFDLDNVILAPHLGWYSEEANWSIREKIVEDFVRFIEGRPPRFLVNKELASEVKA